MPILNSFLGISLHTSQKTSLFTGAGITVHVALRTVHVLRNSHLGDYLRNGRPEYYETDAIFLKLRAPFEPFEPSSSGLSSMLRRLCRKAGIPTDNKHRGFHSLRHTAACLYLEMGTPVPVIAEILGHSDIDSTSVYLKTELEKLAECVLEPMEFNDEGE